MKARQFGWLVVVALVAVPGSLGAQQAADGASGEKGKLDRPHGQRERDDERRQSRRKWWMEAADRAELGITDQQSAKIEEIWQSVASRQRERYHEHQRLEPQVEQLVKDMSADPAHVGRQVERLHALKAELNATRILMLYRQLRELSPAQREKLKRMEERRELERRKLTDSQNRR